MTPNAFCRPTAKARKGTQKQPLVPKAWVLIQRSPDGTEKQITENVLAWDMSSNGQLAGPTAAIFSRRLQKE
ncbi:MAG TPA: hypothetical protein PLY87_22745 [Planctomycetaceae bacterium]|nr:hypothetical protein [Planctomycetaceae bacterium]HQZ67935.1 hypothetical protein [Planctomycetaceae bacterium]